MTNTAFKFYSVLKNEDANPYIGDNILVVADGLGGSGSAVHTIDRAKHADMHGDIIVGAFGDMKDVSPKLMQYIEELIAPMVDGKDDTSALWASRIVIARCVYALAEGEFKQADLSDKKTRAKLAEFIEFGLHEVAKNFDLQKGKYDGQLLLPTTLAFIRYTEEEHSVIVETVWAGDSRCYALTPDGFKLLSVDDEDNSGSITNLFYADNGKVTLNYICHEIAKPCALLAVSDGIFDPFDPHDHLGVENTLLSAIKKSNAPQEFAAALYDFYGSIHGDDATMAFVPFGFDSFEDMQKKFARRTDEILAVCKKQGELYGALEVMNQSEEEASHYVLSRTNDRYDYIVPTLIDAAEAGADDIAIVPEIRVVVENARKRYNAEVCKARKNNREQALAELDHYVKAHPERVNTEILTCATISVNCQAVASLYSDFKQVANDLAACLSRDSDQASHENELAAWQQELHALIQVKIEYYRKCFDDLWFSKEDEAKKRTDIYTILCVWQRMDNALKFGWGVQDISKLPMKERELAYAVQDYITDLKTWRTNANSRKNTIARLTDRYACIWRKLFERLRGNECLTDVLLSPKARHKFGFDVTDESFLFAVGKERRVKIIYELKVRKAAIVIDIVKALAINYDKTSLIDGQYNATKLALLRTYYRLKSNPDNGIRALEEQLSALEVAYTSLIIL